MERRICFGSMQEVSRPDGFSKVETRPECRSCAEMMDCLRHGRKATEERDERVELKKQEMIAQILDLSQILTNEVGSCVLEFLNRIYQSPLGVVLFNNLLLFVETPPKGLAFSLTVPVSRAVIDLVQGEQVESAQPSDRPEASEKRQASRGGVTLRIIVIQRYFPDDRKANMGLIAREVIRIFSSDRDGVDQIRRVLTASEGKAFMTMAAESRVGWLMQKWGFQEELRAAEEKIRG
jgi:hypothetical protein